MNGTELQQLINMFKDLAPQLWQIAFHQVYVVACADYLGATLFGVTSILSLTFGFYARIRELNFPKIWKDRWNEIHKDYPNYETFRLIMWLITGISFISFLLEIFFILMYLQNPAWYAIKFLLSIQQ